MNESQDGRFLERSPGENDRAEGGGVEERNDARAEKSKKESAKGCRQDRGPIEGDVPRVTLDGDRRSGAGSKLVRPENGRDWQVREQDQHGRQLDQAAAAHDGIDEAGEKR